MQVEEALIRLGTDPIRKSPFSNVLLAVINSYFRRGNDEPITMDTPGDIALSRIYELPNATQIRQHQVGNLRDRDSYRMTLTIMAMVIVIAVTLIAVVEIASVDSEHSGFGMDFLGRLVEGGLRLLDHLIKT